MAPLPCSSFMMCVRTQPIAWKVPVQMTYQNLVMYRKCFMHCDILIYSYSSVSISQCNFGDSPRANFLFTGFIVQFAFYHCWLAPSPLLASIRSFHVIRVQSVFQCFGAALKQYDITIFITNMLKLRYWKIRMQYKKKDISVNDVGFRFRNIKSNVFSHEAWRFNIVYCILVMVWFGKFYRWTRWMFASFRLNGLYVCFGSENPNFNFGLSHQKSFHAPQIWIEITYLFWSLHFPSSLVDFARLHHSLAIHKTNIE